MYAGEAGEPESASEPPVQHDVSFDPEVPLEGEDTEAVRAKAIRDPGAPTAREVAEHELTHLPHRSWCAACVTGRSSDRQHKRSTRDPSNVPCIVADYGFLGGIGDEETVPVLIARDIDTKMLFAHVVPRKGLVAEHGVNQLVKDIDRMGHTKMCLKTDGEAALVSMQQEVKKRRSHETLLENSPAGDSRANGAAERAVRSIAEQVRVVRASLEDKLGAKLPGTHAVTCWLVEHCADLLNKYQCGEDGRTAYHRLRGKPWAHEIVAFGEKVHYRVNLKSLPKEYKLEGRWGEGFFMGIKWRTGESWIATADGIVKTSAIRRVGAHRRWDAESLLKVKGVPWDHVQRDATPGNVRVQWLDPPAVGPVHVFDEGPQPRRVYIKRDDLYRHGFTEGCPGCRSISQGGEPRGHTDACRTRLETAMRTTEAGKARVQKAKERIDTEVARRMERLLAQEEAPEAKRARVAPNSQAGCAQPQTTPAAASAEGQIRVSESSSSSHDAPMEDITRASFAPNEEQYSKTQSGDTQPSMEVGDIAFGSEVSHVERMMQEDFRWRLGDVSNMCEDDPDILKHAVADMTYYDENTGEILDQRLVRIGEAEELHRFAKMDVYGYADRQSAINDPEGVFVNVKWVRVNKGTRHEPQVKCRLVAQELGYGTRMDELFANTPSLACVKLAMIHAAESRKFRKLMTLDVKSAFLYGAARRKIYIELPSADPKAGGDKVGVLRKALYGTRDAPQIWQHEVRRTLKGMGFRQSVLQPSVYMHDSRDILLVVHVDDFLVAATQEELDWVYAEMSKAYELKRKVISSSPGDAHDTSYLNRRLKWDVHNMMSYEGDGKHADRLLKEWGLHHCKAVSSTMTKELEVNVGMGPELSESEGRRVRQAIARINFMCQDRPDLCSAARVLSQHMAAPTEGTKAALQHVVKYLKGNRRCINSFVADIPPEQYNLAAYCDSDWANERTARKSCSGGVVLLAGIPVAFWSKTQSNIALSSGEAELNSSVKVLSEVLGISHLWEELYKSRLTSTVHVDSSACKGMLLRSGVGRVKHLSTKQLWVQAAIESYGITVVKIPRSENCADMLTHSVPQSEAHGQLKRMFYTCHA